MKKIKKAYLANSVRKASHAYLWDYDYEELVKTESGRRLILERKINYGPDGEKINIEEVKRNWGKLDLFPDVKRLLEYLIWGKILPKSKKLFWNR